MHGFSSDSSVSLTEQMEIAKSKGPDELLTCEDVEKMEVLVERCT